MYTDNQTQILATLTSHLDKEYYLSELGEILQKHPGVFQRGINSLERQGIIISHKKGNQRLFSINKKHPLFNEIKAIIQKTMGAEGLLRKKVLEIKEISIALIYGTYARDKMRSDSDIDILIVGDIRVEDILLKKIEKIEKKLQREINYKLYSKIEFVKKRKTKDPFLEEILSDRYILLKGTI
ncbi:MAG: ArsR family transcriptional regulator [Elusimicrobiota bacterium]